MSAAARARMQTNPITRRRDSWVALVLMLIVLTTGCTRLVPLVCGVYHDDGIYVAAGQAIAQHGAYLAISMPGSLPQAKYPVLYPALLAAVWMLWPHFPGNVIVMQALSLIACACAIGFGYLYVVRFGYCRPRAAFATSLICAAAPGLLYFGTLPLSEMPFALLAVLASWKTESLHAGEEGGGRAVTEAASGALLALPMLCRSIGISLLLTGAAIAVFSRRRCRRVPASLAGLGCLRSPAME